MLDVICEKCSGRLTVEGLNTFSSCPGCRLKQKVVLFSSIEKEPEKGAAPEAVLDDHAACINHPEKSAAALCDGCGAYICNLCDIEIEKQHLCPRCFNNTADEISSVSKKTELHDSRALAIAFVSILIGPLSLLTAPIAIGWALFHWNKINTPYKRGKWRFVVTLMIATGLFFGWSVWLIYRIWI
ncbi:MAG: hypothetical protein L3J71_09765 [Victivallaceae bacterium]|nr:hypothetical protein [Victivallaceae bacterium]